MLRLCPCIGVDVLLGDSQPWCSSTVLAHFLHRQYSFCITVDLVNQFVAGAGVRDRLVPRGDSPPVVSFQCAVGYIPIMPLRCRSPLAFQCMQAG